MWDIFLTLQERCSYIYIAESSWLMHLQLLFPKTSIYVLSSFFNSSAFRSSFLLQSLREAHCSLISGSVVSAPENSAWLSSKENHGSGYCGQGHSSCFVTSGSELFIPAHKGTLKLALQGTLHYVKVIANGNKRSLILMYLPVQHATNYLIKSERSEFLL